MLTAFAKKANYQIAGWWVSLKAWAWLPVWLKRCNRGVVRQRKQILTFAVIIASTVLQGCNEPMDATPSPSPIKADEGKMTLMAAPPELKSTINDILALLQAGDMAQVSKKYFFITEDGEHLSTIELSAPTQQELQRNLQRFQAIQNQTPKMNLAGDKATYQFPIPTNWLRPGEPTPPAEVAFKKINGRWYYVLQLIVLTGPC